MQGHTRILLEGNIGAGKSTIGRELKASALFDFIEEPVNEWKTGLDSNMLDVFYRDMNRWAFTFQYWPAQAIWDVLGKEVTL